MKEGNIPTRREIEEHLIKVGDYVKMDYLSACLKKHLDFDSRKFVLTKLAEIYDSRGMFSEAAKLMRASADINTTFNGKIDDFMKSMELFIKSGSYEEADISFNKGLVLANTSQKGRLREIRKIAYIKQAKDYLNKDKRTHSMKVYEKIMTLDLSPEERKDSQQKLMKLYEQLGKVKEFYVLKKNIESGINQFREEPKNEERVRRETSVDELMGW